MKKKKIIISGASGFIGKHLIASIPNNSFRIYKISRYKTDSNMNELIIPDINEKVLWKDHLNDTKYIIHLAACAHISNKDVTALNKFRTLNTRGTLHFAKEAALAGVKRFIFISSIGVNGTYSTIPFKNTDTPQPTEAYSVSKLDAEIGLRKISKQSGMEIVIIRPPLVYGPNAPGNFGKLIKLINSKLPLPLGAIHNKRSLVALDNLVDLIVTCIEHPKAANQTFLVSDDADVSTTELLQKMAEAMGKKAWLLPIPESWLRVCAKIVGKEDIISRLCGSLQVDIQHTKDTLNWHPPVTMSEQLAKIFPI